MIQNGKSKLERQREYNRKYYQKNKRRISNARKVKYLKNPKIQNQIKRKSLAHYYRRKSKDNSRVNYSVKEIGGVTLYSIQYAAAVMGKSADTLRQWEKEKIVPLTTYVDSRGWRLYTGHQLKVLSIAARKLSKKEFTKVTMAEYLRQEWENGEQGEQ